MLLSDCDVAYGKNIYETDDGLELFKRFQEQAPSEFSNALYIWISDFAKTSGLSKDEQLIKIRTLMRVLSLPLGVFYSINKDGFNAITKQNITNPVRTFSGFGLSGSGVTEEMMHEMLKSIHPDFSEYLKTALQEASLPDYLHRIVYWVTFALVEALGGSTHELLMKVAVKS
ncbi:MAG: hypothetical protein Q7R91_01105 [bacterium]|nr:hypothetical protein [bacterium]